MIQNQYYRTIHNKEKELSYLFILLSLLKNQNDSLPYFDLMLAVSDQDGHEFIIPSIIELENKIVENDEHYAKLEKLWMTTDVLSSSTLTLEKKELLLSTVENLMDKYPKISFFKIYYVMILCSEERYDDAKNILKELISNTPNNYELFAFMATILWKQKSYNEAIDYISNSKKISQEPTIYFLEGQIYEDMKQYKQASNAYQEGINVIKSRYNEFTNLNSSNLMGVMQNRIKELNNKF